MASIAQVIPNDILHEIFFHFAKVHESLEVNANKPGHFPWYLGHICSQWRTTVLAFVPRKLRVSSVFKLQRDAKMLRCVTNIVTFFLELNRGHQFDLNLIGSFCSPWRDKVVSRILELLVVESAHWHHVTLNHICNCFAGLAHYQVKDHLLSLQSLWLQGRYIQCMPRSNPGNNFRNFFTNAPSLTHVEVASIASWDFEIDLSNHSNVTYLYLGGSNMYPPVSFPQAINLNTLVVDWRHNGNLPYDRTITLPHLESCKLANNGWLRYIRAPALQNLCLYRIPATKTKIDDIM